MTVVIRYVMVNLPRSAPFALVAARSPRCPTENYHGSNTVILVITLMSVVGGVFIVFAMMALCYRSVVVHKNFSLCLRRSTIPKYEPPYVKKPISKKYTPSASNHQDDIMDANKIFGTASYSRADSQRVLFRPSNHMSAVGATPHFQEHKMQQLKRMGVGSGSEEDPTHSGEEETVSFIDLQHNNLSKLPEKKGILKKHGYGLVMVDGKDNWGGGSQSDNLEIMSQSDNNIGEMMNASGGGGGSSGASMSEVERTLKSLNGYHEDILEALRNAASHRGAAATPSGSSTMLSEEILRKTLQDCSNAAVPGYNDYGKRTASQEKICELPQTHTVMVEGSPSRLHIHQHQHQAPADEDEDDEVPPCGPIRIRNLEDLIRQLEHHTRHMSPNGSEDIRMSETEADRHYRLDSSSACSESSQSQSSRCRGRGDDETRFVYGRYRHPTGGRHQYPHPHHQHHAHQHMAEEESIYETADHDRGADQCGDTPDSESSTTVSPVGE